MKTTILVVLACIFFHLISEVQAFDYEKVESSILYPAPTVDHIYILTEEELLDIIAYYIVQHSLGPVTRTERNWIFLRRDKTTGKKVFRVGFSQVLRVPEPPVPDKVFYGKEEVWTIGNE